MDRFPSQSGTSSARDRDRTSRPALRRGAAYLSVLGMTLVTAVISLGALHAVRAQSQSSDSVGDMAEARLYALSAVEWGRREIAASTSWRTDHTNGVWLNQAAIGNTSGTAKTHGKFSLSVVNPNGALNRFDADPVVLTATGYKGDAVQTFQVTLTPKINPLNCLTAALTSGGNITFGTADVNPTGHLIASNGSITAGFLIFGADIYPNVEAVGSISGFTYHGSVSGQSSNATRDLPASTAFDYYNANGTSISITSIPLVVTMRTISRALLSPASNPFGAQTNAQGIYVIDCQGQSVTITNSRIVGTLVLLNAGVGATVDGSVVWSAAVSNYPCLMVQGSLTLKSQQSSLSESGGTNVNFNPAGTPYPYSTGVTDSDTSDSYTSAIDGLVYVSSNLTIENHPTVSNLVVGGTTTFFNDLTLNYNAGYFTNPPPGFYKVDMLVTPGTWKQIVSP